MVFRPWALFRLELADAAPISRVAEAAIRWAASPFKILSIVVGKLVLPGSVKDYLLRILKAHVVTVCNMACLSTEIEHRVVECQA
jgi:hypothetical protein